MFHLSEITKTASRGKCSISRLLWNRSVNIKVVHLVFFVLFPPAFFSLGSDSLCVFRIWLEIQNKLQKQWDIKEQSIKYGSEQVEKGVI